MRLQRKDRSELEWFHNWYWYLAAFVLWLIGVVLLETKGGGINGRLSFYSTQLMMWFFMTVPYVLSFFKRVK